jgi:hypothetical protein
MMVAVRRVVVVLGGDGGPWRWLFVVVVGPFLVSVIHWVVVVVVVVYVVVVAAVASKS